MLPLLLLVAQLCCLFILPVVLATKPPLPPSALSPSSSSILLDASTSNLQPPSSLPPKGEADGEVKGYGREGKGYGREGKERKERAERKGRRERRGEEREERGGGRRLDGHRQASTPVPRAPRQQRVWGSTGGLFCLLPQCFVPCSSPQSPSLVIVSEDIILLLTHLSQVLVGVERTYLCLNRGSLAS